jgi:aspartokinase/homoserine dehydrogenase 1
MAMQVQLFSQLQPLQQPFRGCTFHITIWAFAVSGTNPILSITLLIMKLIKIEGRLLSSAENINQAIQLLNKQDHESLKIVVTGNQEVENKFEEIAKNAIDASIDYTEKTAQIETEYLQLVRKAIPIAEQSVVLSFVKQRFNELEDLCKGIQLLGEIPQKTLDEIRVLPSAMSAFIFYSAYRYQNKNISYEGGADQKSIHIRFIENIPKAARIIEDGKSRGDYAAAQLAIDYNASTIECWMEEHPYYTADPSIVHTAKPILDLSYEEAIELSNYDQNIIHPLALGLLIQKGIIIRLVNIGLNQSITTISNQPPPKKGMITGISIVTNVSLISIEGGGMVGVPGFAKRVFGGLHDAGINIILISQGASEHSICVAVKAEHANNASNYLNELFHQEISSGVLQKVYQIADASIIGLVGENMRSHPGISGRMFSALGRNGVNVLAIAQGSNEKNISAVIKSADKSKALHVLHEAFFEDSKKEINLFIIGTGNVGKKLIGQIQQQLEPIKKMHNIKLNVAGLSNSRKMLIDPTGISLSNWDESLQTGQSANLELFANEIIRLNLRNSVLIDITANENVPTIYANILRKSMSVVACNKIAASDTYEKYKELKELAVEYNCKFLFETNVGAALPIIGTLNDLAKSGDQIQKIQAVLSGTLNYVFNHYDGSKPFSEVVRDAQIEGYTEPDPRLDLSGRDVMRKILILTREAGNVVEMNDLTCNSFLPESCMHGSVDDFYNEMLQQEQHFMSLLLEAKKNEAKLKFVAHFENGKASVGLQHIKSDSEMYHLYGKDNIVLFYTNRYLHQPLVIKGAGAGAEVTASGVFADILRTINN